MTETITASLAQWLCSAQYEHLPAQVREITTDVIYDAVGGMVACSTLPEVKAIVELIDAHGGRQDCSIVGHRAKNSVINAAMANGGAARGGEVDAVHLTSSGGHVAPGPVSTALAVGEWLGASGHDVVRAVVLGYEIGGRLMTIFYRERDYVSRRFYPTSVIASLSSAVTAGILLGLDARSLQVALGLAAYQAAGPDNMTKDPGHMGMTFQCAAANRNGVTAALLAHRGCHAPLDILDGALGFFDAYLGRPDIGAELLHDMGRYYSITDVMYKRYPVGTPNQTYAQGLFHLLEQHPLAPEEIESIEIQMPQGSLHTVPKTRHASIAINVVSAVAVVEGKLDFYRLHDPGVVNPAVAKMQEKIRFVPRADWTGTQHNRHAIVTIAMTTGTQLEEEVWFRPMTRPELEEKFDALVMPQFGLQRTRELQALLRSVESASSVRPLMEALRG
ncbi:MAG TPA: MmgE/PrpD family protein [Burkholderiales bacterium]|nr:MmgE/PrpD family protein [Burkholderiales bacterium]